MFFRYDVSDGPEGSNMSSMVMNASYFIAEEYDTTFRRRRLSEDSGGTGSSSVGTCMDFDCGNCWSLYTPIAYCQDSECLYSDCCDVTDCDSGSYPDDDNNNNDNDTKGANTGVIVGAVVGSLCGVLFLGAGGYYYYRQNIASPKDVFNINNAKVNHTAKLSTVHNALHSSL